MQRREFITLLGSAAASSVCWPLAASAQTTSIFRLGTLGPRDPFDDKSPFGSILVRVLAQRGYTLGQNLTLDARGAMGDMHRVPQLLQEMKADKVDAFVVTGFPVALAAKTMGIPTVVAFGAGDPVATGLVQSLSRPGGNITGISDNATELSTKRLSLLKQLNPNLRRVAMLWNKDDLGMSKRYEASANVAQSVGVTVMPLGVREPNDFNEAFAAMTREPPDAILMVSDALTTLNRKRVFEYAASRRLPAIYEYDFLVRDGGLMSYGADLKESFERAGDLVARIFKGAQPGDLSILGRAIALPSHTRGGSRMRESRPYGSVRGARDETRVPTATSPSAGAHSCGWLSPATRHFRDYPLNRICRGMLKSARNHPFRIFDPVTTLS